MRIMIVEDEFYIAQKLAREITDHGDEVIGPYGNVDDAVLNVDKADAAILDIKLGRGDSFAVAEILERRKQPFLFLTGYDRSILPARFNGHHVYAKPSHALPLIDDLRAQQNLIPADTRIEQAVREMLVLAYQAMPDHPSAERLVETVLLGAIEDVSSGGAPENIRKTLLMRFAQELMHGRLSHLH